MYTRDGKRWDRTAGIHSSRGGEQESVEVRGCSRSYRKILKVRGKVTGVKIEHKEVSDKKVQVCLASKLSVTVTAGV